MNEFQKYVNEILEVLKSLTPHLSRPEQQEIEYLIAHDECGEALRTLAWIIVEEKKKVPRATIYKIEELAIGLVAKEDMPKELQAHGE